MCHVYLDTPVERQLLLSELVISSFGFVATDDVKGIKHHKRLPRLTRVPTTVSRAASSCLKARTEKRSVTLYIKTFTSQPHNALLPKRCFTSFLSPCNDGAWEFRYNWFYIHHFLSQEPLMLSQQRRIGFYYNATSDLVHPNW